MRIVNVWENRASAIKQRFGSTVIACFGAFCQQSVEITSRLASGRFLLIFVFFCSILIYNFYTSVLVSTLVGSSLESTIKTTGDLAGSNYRIGFANVTYMRGFMKVVSHRISRSDANTFR